jgi:hypothetical protein
MLYTYIGLSVHFLQTNLKCYKANRITDILPGLKHYLALRLTGLMTYQQQFQIETVKLNENAHE